MQSSEVCIPKPKHGFALTEADGSVTFTDYFDIRRGVVQGDCFSALAFIIAVESVMRKHDPEGGVSVLGRLVSRLEFADDIALIDQTPEAASNRLTVLAKAFRDDADMHVAIGPVRKAPSNLFTIWVSHSTPIYFLCNCF